MNSLCHNQAQPVSTGFERNNPYASPAEVALPQPPEMSRAEAVRLLKPPAIGLLISLLISLGWGGWIVVDNIRAGDAHLKSEGWYVLTTIISLMATGVLTGSIQILREKVRFWPWVAIVPGLIPFGLTCITVPCAFWLLHRMLRKDIRAALARPA